MLPFLLLLKSRCILKDEYMYIPFSLEQTSKQLNPNVYTFTYIENIGSVYTSVYKPSFLGVLTIFNEGAYLTFKSIFHKALNLS